MQSGVTQSKTSVAKSLPASFKTLNILLINRELNQTTRFLMTKQGTFTIKIRDF